MIEGFSATAGAANTKSRATRLSSIAPIGNFFPSRGARSTAPPSALRARWCVTTNAQRGAAGGADGALVAQFYRRARARGRRGGGANSVKFLNHMNSLLSIDLSIEYVP